MVNYIMNNIDKLFNDIKSSSLYSEYSKIGDILKKDENISELMNEINKLQSEALCLEYVNNPKYKEINKIIEEKVNVLNNNEVYQEYLKEISKFNKEINERENLG